MAVQFLADSETSRRLREVLDAAEAGKAAGVERRGSRVALVERDRLHGLLADSRQLGRPEAMAEADGWSVFFPGTPIAADGSDSEVAVEEFIKALREYSEDWENRLRLVANHEHHWPLVLFVAMSSDAELASWVYGKES
ncbi:prevent-host-death protein [Candidatus Poriferisocius sp.]|uniref:prevent-host-death protein n=1 Tax=Candidatus Poriferisocius sp. TaxID=3101276 RepID=UPI003B017CE6